MKVCEQRDGQSKSIFHDLYRYTWKKKCIVRIKNEIPDDFGL